MLSVSSTACGDVVGGDHATVMDVGDEADAQPVERRRQAGRPAASAVE